MFEMKIDRKSIDKAIKEMNLFPETKKVTAAYQNEVAELTKRQAELERELEVLQEQHIKLLMDKEQAFEVSDRIYFTRQAKELNNDVTVITSMLEELSEARHQLREKYVPLFQSAIDSDNKNNVNGKYQVNSLVEKMVYETLKAITDLNHEMQSQYLEVAGEVLDVIRDPQIVEQYPRLKYVFNGNQYRPVYTHNAFNTVLSQQDISAALEGQILQHIKRPEVK